MPEPRGSPGLVQGLGPLPIGSILPLEGTEIIGSSITPLWRDQEISKSDGKAPGDSSGIGANLVPGLCHWSTSEGFGRVGTKGQQRL